MGWKDILDFDLGRLAGGGAPAEEATPRVYWWKAIWRIFRLPSPFRENPNGGPIPRGLSRSAKRVSWKGPVYWNARSWRRDVVLVVEQLRGLVACNMSLPPGLAAAAEEEVRIRKGWSPQRASALLRNLGIFSLFVFICFGIAVEPNGISSAQSYLLAACAIALAVWFVWSFIINRNSRTRVFLALEHRLAMGMSLSQAMTSLPRFFPRHLADLIEAGETAGNLDLAFDQFSDAMLRSLSLHRRLKLSLLYIKVILFAQASIVFYVLLKVVPVWIEILQEVDPSREAATVFWEKAPILHALLPDIGSMARLGETMVEFAYILIPTAILFIVWQFLSRFRNRRSWASRGASSFLLLLPWLRGLVIRHNLGLIARLQYGLLRAGVPLDRSLAMAMSADLLPAYRHWLSDFRERILQGDSVAEGLDKAARKSIIPESFRGLLEAGERSGQLPEMFSRIANLYEAEAEKRLHILVALILPLGIFLMGYITLCVQMLVFGSMAQLIESLLM